MESIVIEAAGETSAEEAPIARPQWPEESSSDDEGPA